MKNLYYKTFITAVILLFVINCSAQKNSQLKTSGDFYTLPEEITEEDYVQKTIIFRVKSENRINCSNDGIRNAELSIIFNSLGIVNLSKKFPRHNPPENRFDEYGNQYTDLSLIYELKYSAEIPVDKVINYLFSTKIIEYAEPHFIHKTLYVPDDPAQSSQFYLQSIRAYQAWDISKGDTNIVIGIVDTGTDLDHEDLENSIKYNYSDPIDGIDNDNDGYLDNFYGWDLGENDNNPQVHIVGHGSHVSGISSATADNAIGMAGVGFNCKFMPIKVDDEQGYFVKGYEGIIYAADHGCDIINCSWGGKFGEGQYGQEIVNYAVINENAVVVAACGNDHNENVFYPASYANVISVAGTDSNDVLWAGSSYGINIDICAPGTFIYSTWNGGYYITSHGTSMAAPMVSAAAAIVKSQYPNLSAIQIGEQLKVTADNIDTIPGNSSFAQKLGSGRLNMYNALVNNNKPSINLISHEIILDNPGNTTYDTLNLTASFINYLSPTSNLNITVSCSSTYVEVVPAVLNLGVMQTNGIKTNLSNPFKIIVYPNIPNNYKVEFKITYSDTSYSAFQYISHIFNPDFLNIETENLSVTLTSKSKIGYNDDFHGEGLGFIYKKDKRSILYSSGLVVGSSSSKVSDNIIGDSGYNHDFASKVKINKINPTVFSDNDYQCIFTDSLAGPLKLNIEVTQNTYTWDSLQDSKYIILEYFIKNKDLSTLSNIYAAFYVDWDLNPSHKNRVSYDAALKMGYSFSTLGGTYAGIKLLTEDSVIHYAFDNDGSDGSLKLYDGFPSFEKYEALKTNRHNAGFGATTGNDISDMISSGPFTIASGDTIKVAFALLVGNHLLDLRNSAQAAHDKYYNTTSVENIEVHSDNIRLYQNYPNPFSNNTNISFYLPCNEFVDLSIYNILGQKVLNLTNSNLSQGYHKFTLNSNKLENGIYYYCLSVKNKKLTKKMIIL